MRETIYEKLEQFHHFTSRISDSLQLKFVYVHSFSQKIAVYVFSLAISAAPLPRHAPFSSFSVSFSRVCLVRSPAHVCNILFSARIPVIHRVHAVKQKLFMYLFYSRCSHSAFLSFRCKGIEHMTFDYNFCQCCCCRCCCWYFLLYPSVVLELIFQIKWWAKSKKKLEKRYKPISHVLRAYSEFAMTKMHIFHIRIAYTRLSDCAFPLSQ